MTARPRRTATATLGLAATVAALAFAFLLAAGAGEASAASACKRHGDTSPTKLKRKQARKAVLCLVNAERKSRGLPKLRRQKRLQKAAQRHSNRMRGSGCFAHQCPGESDLTARLRDVRYLTGGLSRWVYGENVAWGERWRGTPKSIVRAWMKSPGHRANILNPQFRDLGVGFAPGSPQAKKAAAGLYTSDFGLRVG